MLNDKERRSVINVSFGGATPREPEPPINEASRSHSDTPHSMGLLWTSNQPDAKSST